MTLLLLLLLQCSTLNAFPFAALGVISSALLAYVGKDRLECAFRECCADSILYNKTGLQWSLQNQLHGQHVAAARVLYHIQAHMEDPSPAKALALSFHGYTGVGKNFVSNIIAKHMLVKGTQSRFYHFYDSLIHFKHLSKIDEYKEKLHKELVDAATICPFSIFVFDEMHVMPAGILDVLAPALEFRESVDGADFRRSIFLFLSNAGGSDINRYLYDHLVSGKLREDAKYMELNRILTRSAFNDKGGLLYSELIQKHLITAMVPFFPLQADHIRNCTRDVAARRGIPFTEELAVFILNELEWSPEGTTFFSTSGCKRVYEKVGLYMQQYS